MIIKIPKIRKPELSPEGHKALTKLIRAGAFKPGDVHKLPVSGREYVVAADGSWRRK